MAPKTKFDKSEAVANDATFDPSSLKGKSIIITGGASGLGEEFMREFVKAGCFVTFGDLAEDRGKALVADLGEENVAFVKCNVWAWADQLKLFKTALEKSPAKAIDIVCANAGISGQDDIFNQKEDHDGEPVEPSLAILQTNLIGVAYTAKLAMFYLPKQAERKDRDRCLIITCSLAGYLDLPGSPQYTASKFGVRGMMRSLRQTGPRNGIRVNLIAPWFIGTRIMSDEVKQQIKSNNIDFAEKEDAAAAVLHLASDKAINGRSFAVVPRNVSRRGYYDLERDDWNSGDYMTEWQNMTIAAGHRMRTDMNPS